MYTVSFSVLFRQKLWLASQCIIGTKASSSLDHTLDILADFCVENAALGLCISLCTFSFHIFGKKCVPVIDEKSGGLRKGLLLLVVTKYKC